MASSRAFVDHVIDQVDLSQPVTCRAMFGEYGLYVGSKMVALVCDDRLFLKPTEEARSFLGQVVEAPPYPGARPHFLIEDRLDDREFLTDALRITAEALPEPKPKKRKKGRG
jgi:TfoX/Sxy family transcriptional regulator of competence genes